MGQESTKTGDTELLFDMPSTALGEQNSGPQSFWHDGFGMVQAHYIYCAATDLIGGGAQVVMRVMESGCKYR